MTGDQLSIDDALARLEAERQEVLADLHKRAVSQRRGTEARRELSDLADQMEAQLGDVIPSRTSDPATSHAAAKEIRVKANSQRAYLLKAFYWLTDATDEQAMARSIGRVSPTSEFAKRCSELRQGGFIEPTGETRAGNAGPQRIVSRITDKGRQWIQDNR